MPGAQAIRAACRICLALLLPASVGFARCVEALADRGRPLAAWALAAFSILEQGETTPTYNKAENRQQIAALAGKITPERCGAFLFSPVQGQLPYWKYQTDALWAQMETGVPTVNGYSRTGPPGWGLNEVNITYEGDEDTIRAQLLLWEENRGLRPAEVCWLKVRQKDGPNQADFVSQSVPAEMISGQGYDVEVTMKNSGDSTWVAADGYHLGAQAPQDTKNWVETARVDPPGEIHPGQTASFKFHVVAPEAGRVAFRWRMVREGILWFGEYSGLAWVDVRPKPP